MIPHRLVLLFLISIAECQYYDRQLVDSLRNDSNVRWWRRWRGVGGELEGMLSVYEPSLLAAVWPRLRNGVHLRLGAECYTDLTTLYKDLARGRAWAYDVVDASGRYSSGLLSGRNYWLGSKEQCLKMSNDFTEFGENETLTAIRNNEYITSILDKDTHTPPDAEEWSWVMQDEVMQQVLAAEHRPPYALLYSRVHLTINITRITMYQSHEVTVGVCLPRSCAPHDLEALLQLSLALSDSVRTNGTVPRLTALTSVRQTDGTYDFTGDTAALVVATLTLALLALALAATALDRNILQCFPYSKRSMSFDLPKHNNELSLVSELKRKHTELMSAEVVEPGPAPRKVSMAPVAGSAGRGAGSCARCGKYRRQCPNATQVAGGLPACPRLKYSSFASLSTEDRRNALWCRLLLCFSLATNLRRVFNRSTATRELATVHAVRALATLWVVFVHVALIASYGSNNAGDLNKREGVYYILTTGTIAFDTLFFVSGLISSHHLFYLKSRYSVRELVSFGGACGQLMQLVCFVTNRIIRSAPSYLMVVVWAGVAARWSWAAGGGALPDRQHEACTHWWRNVLYVSHAYPAQERCVLASWAVSLDVQLHAVCAAGGVVAAGGGARARLAAALAAALALAALAADLSETLLQERVHFLSSLSVYEWMVGSGWSRVPPYVCGAVAGALAHHYTHRPLNTNRVISSLVWLASVSLGVSAVGGAWAGGGWAGGWVHGAWALALLWPSLLVCTTYAAPLRGLRRWAWLSRLSAGVLISHGVFARLLLLAGEPLCSHLVCIGCYFCWVCVCGVMAALWLALLVEMPVCALLRTLSHTATT